VAGRHNHGRTDSAHGVARSSSPQPGGPPPHRSVLVRSSTSGFRSGLVRFPASAHPASPLGAHPLVRLPRSGLVRFPASGLIRLSGFPARGSSARPLPASGLVQLPGSALPGSRASRFRASRLSRFPVPRFPALALPASRFRASRLPTSPLARSAPPSPRQSFPSILYSLAAPTIVRRETRKCLIRLRFQRATMLDRASTSQLPSTPLTVRRRFGLPFLPDALTVVAPRWEGRMRTAQAPESGARRHPLPARTASPRSSRQPSAASTESRSSPAVFTKEGNAAARRSGSASKTRRSLGSSPS
jgi:hypothetical protein